MELLEYNVVLQKSVYAELTVYIPKFDLEIAKCREFRTDGEKGPRRWFSFPSYYYETMENKGYKPIIRFRLKATEDAFWHHVRKLVDDHLAKHPELDVKPQTFDENIKELPF